MQLQEMDVHSLFSIRRSSLLCVNQLQGERPDQWCPKDTTLYLIFCNRQSIEPAPPHGSADAQILQPSLQGASHARGCTSLRTLHSCRRLPRIYGAPSVLLKLVGIVPRIRRSSSGPATAGLLRLYIVVNDLPDSTSCVLVGLHNGSVVHPITDRLHKSEPVRRLTA